MSLRRTDELEELAASESAVSGSQSSRAAAASTKPRSSPVEPSKLASVATAAGVAPTSSDGADSPVTLAAATGADRAAIAAELEGQVHEALAAVAAARMRLDAEGMDVSCGVEEASHPEGTLSSFQVMAGTLQTPSRTLCHPAMQRTS